jgi:flagellar FliL protein
MSGTKALAQGAGDEGEEAPNGNKGKMMLMIGVLTVLIAIGAGVWFSGILPKGLAGRARMADAAGPPTYLDVPDIITNLNVPGRRQTFLKLHAKLELASAADIGPVTAAMPRILDVFQTYLRDMRPEELRGSEGSYRLREELVNRAGVAVAPAQIRAVLFEELVVQ